MCLTEFFGASLIVNLNIVCDDYVTFQKCIFSVTIVNFEAETESDNPFGKC